ncbi:hypothetical protein OS190_16715 [Sulfitobacter sp. F26204]|uniref:hypothetical protein n=1 Tax=Sulfitobacter sp. F26204 TaxID=2996014 RepID=UPI00225E586A|nr:hypothetical protein [Sulfitobacter sp. F26204]MCX7561212.1 hypothetical protein [Sulfitobacter sp. F26204]
MAYVPMKTDELKKMVMMGKKRPMNFAYNPGPKEQDLMIIDRIKAPEVLGRLAKKEGKGPKVAAGVFEIDAKNFTIKIPKELPGLAKKLRKYLKTMDFSFKIIVLDSNGTLLESDGSDEDQQDDLSPKDPSQAQQATDTQTPPQASSSEPQAATPEQLQLTEAGQQQRADLAERLRKMQSPIADLGTQGIPLGKAAATVIALLKAGSLDKASEALNKMESGLEKAQASRIKPTEPVEEPASPVARRLMDRATAVRNSIDTLQDGASGPVKDKLVQGLAALQAKDWAVADARLAEAESALKNPPPAADPASGDPTQQAASDRETQAQSQQKWESISGQIQASVDKAMQAKIGDPESIQRVFDDAKRKAEAGDFDQAVAAAANTVKLIKAAAAEGVVPARDVNESSTAHVAMYDRSRLNWIKTRIGIRAELNKLKTAIETHTKDVPGLEDVAPKTGVLFTYVDELDTALETTLDALMKSPDAAERDKLKSEAIGIIGTYRTTLNNDFFQAVDDNGFTPTTIRSTALTALAGVETALAA